MSEKARKKIFSHVFWSRHLRQWHWISSALCLAFMLLFAVTGFTLNHPTLFEAEPKSVVRESEISQDLSDQLAEVEDVSVLPAELASALQDETGVNAAGRTAVVEYGEMTIDLARPGVDAYLAIDLEGQFASYESIDRGVIATLNDLHKGRDAGVVWGLLIDLSAFVIILFSLTGFGLLWLQARGRAITWPLTGLGLIIPVIAYVLFVHV